MSQSPPNQPQTLAMTAFDVMVVKRLGEVAIKRCACWRGPYQGLLSDFIYKSLNQLTKTHCRPVMARI